MIEGLLSSFNYLILPNSHQISKPQLDKREAADAESKAKSVKPIWLSNNTVYCRGYFHLPLNCALTRMVAINSYNPVPAIPLPL